MNELALFAGAGGGILGGKLLGWRTVCAVEFNAFCARRLMQRQNEGHLAPFPIWDDVCTFDGRPWKGTVDVVSGGFPCQDISTAGKGAGIEGARSGLWVEMARIINEVRPRFAFVENSPALTLRGLNRVLGDLAEMGYDAEWGVLGASDVGADHKRERIWIMADSESIGHGKRRRERNLHQENGRQNGQVRSRIGGTSEQSENMADTNEQRLSGDVQERFASIQEKKGSSKGGEFSRRDAETEQWNTWPLEPDVGRVADGVAFRVDRLRAIGNGQVPQCHAEAWRRLMDRLHPITYTDKPKEGRNELS